MTNNPKFGARIRQEREERRIGLREMAKKIGVSPTYMSKIERDEFSPPAEDKVLKIADILEIDRDILLALAGRVGSELTEIIMERPREMAEFLRVSHFLTTDDLARMTKKAEGKNKK
jgi:HTH-type transcriptional regulator, competence development regulator